jgi:hypothetical protein
MSVCELLADYSAILSIQNNDDYFSRKLNSFTFENLNKVHKLIEVWITQLDEREWRLAAMAAFFAATSS